MTRIRRAAAPVALILAAASLTGCHKLGSTGHKTAPSTGTQVGDSNPGTGSGDKVAYAADPYLTHSKTSEVYSEFTRDGTYETHTASSGIDLVMTVYATKATPRTHEWYPKGNKYFTFTFQAYDLDHAMRDPYAVKRKVYLSRVKVTSTDDSASAVPNQPYHLDANPLQITLDPHPLAGPHGQMITNPKGALEVRNQAIGTVPSDTTLVTLHFSFYVWEENKPGSTEYTPSVVKETMPVFIYKSNTPTRVLPIPVDGN